MLKSTKISFWGLDLDLKTHVYGGQTPITHNLDKPLLYIVVTIWSLLLMILYILKFSKNQKSRANV